MKASKKRGFTIIELVIVIAVIAILAAVLIPVFSNIIQQAKEANDTALVRNLNSALKMDVTNDHKTMQQALDAVADGGFDLTKIKATASDSKLLWDSKNDCFVYLKKDAAEPTYIPETKKENTAPADYWEIVTDVKSDNAYSQYLNNESLTSVTVSAGFDAGVNIRLTSVKYENKGREKSVILNTNGQMCELTVDAPADHVEHYGYAKKTTVVAVDSNNSYHEYGTSSELVVTAGKIVIEPTGIVFDLKATESATATVSNNGGNVLKSTIDSVKASDNFAINSLAQLEAFRDATNSGVNFADYNSESKKIVLNCDITLTSAWRPISNYHRSDSDKKDKWFAGYFDGNGHTIYGLTNAGLRAEELNSGYDNTTPVGKTEFVYGFFASVKGAKIANLNFANVDIDADESDTFKGDHVAALVGYAEGDVQISNITVKGQIVGYDGTAGVVGGIRGTTVVTGAKVENCKNYATLKTTRRSAGIVGIIFTSCKAVVANCQNYGSVTISNKTDEVQNSIAGIALVAVSNADHYEQTVLIENCTVSESATLTGESNTFKGKIVVLYTTDYNFNSQGNIMKSNNGTGVVSNHIHTSDVCGALVATRKTIDSGVQFICNWNEAK